MVRVCKGRQGDSEGGGRGEVGEGMAGKGDVSAACRLHLHLKWLRLPDTPLRNHVMRDFYCFLPILSFRLGSTTFRYLARDNIRFLAFIGTQHSALPPSLPLSFTLLSIPSTTWFVDRGFRLLSVANVPFIL